MSLAITPRPSPNFDARQRPLDLVVLHYTGMQTLEVALDRLTDPAPKAWRYPGPWQDSGIDPNTDLSRVSAHYVVARSGEIFGLVEEEARAWHAGVSSWRGLEGVNHNAIGIEIENGGHDFGLPAYPDAQVTRVIALVRDILERRRLPITAVVGHSDIAPGRKADPGEHFPWAQLGAAGVALWPDFRPGAPGPVFAVRRDEAMGDEAPEVAALQEALAGIGYGAPVTGAYCATTQACVEAFQRRFRPERVDGALDAQTLERVSAVLALSLQLSLPRRRS
jgi:N-acetylmuramoyl-L-alanine amidase